MSAQNFLDSYDNQVVMIKDHDEFWIDMSAKSETLVYIHNITCYKRGEGIATDCMNVLISEADRFGVELMLEAGPQYEDEKQGSGGVLDGPELVRWYVSLGFDWADAPEMIRKNTP